MVDPGNGGLWIELARDGGIVAALIVLLFILREWGKRKTEKPQPQQRPETLSGEKTVEFWIIEIKKALKEALDEQFKGRNPELHNMLKDTIEQAFESEKFRRTMKEIIGDWLDKRLGGGAPS
jgi:hypothetical protein